MLIKQKENFQFLFKLLEIFFSSLSKLVILVLYEKWKWKKILTAKMKLENVYLCWTSLNLPPLFGYVIWTIKIKLRKFSPFIWVTIAKVNLKLGKSNKSNFLGCINTVFLRFKRLKGIAECQAFLKVNFCVNITFTKTISTIKCNYENHLKQFFSSFQLFLVISFNRDVFLTTLSVITFEQSQTDNIRQMITLS